MTKKAKINSIRILAAKLGNSLAKEERNVSRDELYKTENRKRLTKTERQKAYAYLIELLNTFDNKEKYQHSDHHDLDYFGIRDIKHLFNAYYISILMITINPH